MGTYKYWSPRAQQTMVDHVRGLLGLYGKGMRRLPGSPPRIVMQTMFEPIPNPSFDSEGKKRYLNWLSERYDGDISELNRKYCLSVRSFVELKPDEYWLRPNELNWVGCARPTQEDFQSRTPDFHRWIDNQSYLAWELQNYLATMKQKWRELEPTLWIEPVLHQWGYFFNPPGHPGWQTGQRALDVCDCAEHVDGVLYIASPLNAENRADAMALSVEGSIMRCANQGKPFTGGLYLGRHVGGDIYNVVPPAEAIATLIANGAKRLHIYGYSGLDDGGVLYRMDPIFKQSLRAGNEWASRVIPLLEAPRATQIALLFPAEMSLYEPLEVDVEGRHRMDLLGWYSQLCDLGWQVDIVHPKQAASGALKDYSPLVVPHNSRYDLGDNARLEAAVKDFVLQGGVVLHGPHCGLVRSAFSIAEERVDFDCIDWEELIIPHGWSTVAYPGAKPIGGYIQSGKPAIAETSVGRGRMISFGFQYGYSYSRRTMPIVPPEYGKREMHPIVLLKETPVASLLGPSPLLSIEPIRGVEFAHFGNRLIVVNHRSSPINIRGIDVRNEDPQIASESGTLAAHSATLLKL
jgi:hypothetical protein